MFKHRVLMVMLLLAPALCFADKANEHPLVAQTLTSFESEAATVREGLLPGGTYSFMKDADKARVEQRLDEMHKLLQDHAAQGELSKPDKIALLNAQEALNALLLQNDSNRLICENGTRTGSRIHVTTCKTFGEIMTRQQNDQRVLSDLQKQPQNQRNSGQ
jgi:hypothetical protein